MIFLSPKAVLSLKNHFGKAAMQKTFDNFISQYVKKVSPKRKLPRLQGGLFCTTNIAVDDDSYGIKENGRIGLAVSGGMDSMCLLYLYLNSRELKKNQLFVFSIDHKIRGEDSKRDVEFVEKFCNERQIEFKKFIVDVPFLAAKNKESLETAARNERRRIFEELLESGAEYIFTAHHKSDNVESILMHLFRGAGLNGLIGMKNEKGAQILRPLLEFSKDEIKEFVKENNIAFVVDETNADCRYRRNFIRNEVIPLISSQYGNIENAVINVSKDAALTLKQREDIFFKNVIFIKNGECKIEIAALENNEFASDFLARNLPFEIRNNLERRHFDMVISLVTAQNGVGVDLPNGFRAVREYTHIVIAKREEYTENGMGRNIILTGLFMSVEAMLITIGMTLTLGVTTIWIPLTVGIAHFVYCVATFYLSKYLRRYPATLGAILSGSALIVYGILAFIF
ncbi:MAG: tRNA lysidine(34) synthetase TilS [Firmicutes bacterium]|nr:tRNA lysidine(34) synthetase TilS [Bacillota bacterium]